MVLVRIPAPDTGWVERIPPCPIECTASVGRAELAAVPPAALEARRLRLVGVADPTLDAVFLLVPATAAHRWPGWWAALLAIAEGVSDPRFGPVARRYADVLARHGVVLE